jgi:hypothetical protein
VPRRYESQVQLINHNMKEVLVVETLRNAQDVPSAVDLGNFASFLAEYWESKSKKAVPGTGAPVLRPVLIVTMVCSIVSVTRLSRQRGEVA